MIVPCSLRAIRQYFYLPEIAAATLFSTSRNREISTQSVPIFESSCPRIPLLDINGVAHELLPEIT